MPPGRPPTAKRCSWTCTIRAAGGVNPPGVRRCPTCDAAIDPTTHANRRYCSLYRRPMPLQPRDKGCAVIGRAVGGQWGDLCDQPATRRAVWRFDTPGPRRILLCDQHAAELTGHERLTIEYR